MAYNNIREESLKLKVAADWFPKFDCTDIIGRIDFAVKIARKDSLQFDDEYLLWAEAKQQSTDVFRMLTQLLVTIKQDAKDRIPPRFIGCFDNEKIAFIEYYDIVNIFNINDFNWTQTPSNVDDKSVVTVNKTIDSNKIFTFNFDENDKELRDFIKLNFVLDENANILQTKINKNNFIFIYQKWHGKVMPYIEANWDVLKKNYSIYDRDFFLAEMNVDDKGTTDIHDDTLVDNNFYITFNANEKKQYKLNRKDAMGLDLSYEFRFKNGGLEQCADFWKRYKRPPAKEYWDYIVNRLDLLVPDDVRERKGSFFTPRQWVELSQRYIADTLGEDWQDEYYVWDCCAGTGNLLAGLTNKFNIYASTIDQQDVDVMKERIRNGANLLESHVFQFDFLNDDFSKLPQSLQDIINDKEKREKLVIYINPPYAEAASVKQKTGTGQNKAKVATETYVSKKYKLLIKSAANELFAQFMIRAYYEIPLCVIANFSKLKNLQSPNFSEFRSVFRAKLEKIFGVPADTFDNVKGKFPIGFSIWNTSVSEIFNNATIDLFDRNSSLILKKQVFAPQKGFLLMDWLRSNYDKNGNRIAYLRMLGSDIQNNNGCFLTLLPSFADIRERKTCDVTQNNLTIISIYLALRTIVDDTWINDRDQYLYPNNNWEMDKEFQSNCLVWTLFNGQNRISSKHGPNHWIPFTEEKVGAKERFDSHFMNDFIKGKVKADKAEMQADLFSDVSDNKAVTSGKIEFSAEAKAVMEAGLELWKYYHLQPDANVNASLYDIREHFQGRKADGKMNATSTDSNYNELIAILRARLKSLSKKIEPKVYEYGFLK